MSAIAAILGTAAASAAGSIASNYINKTQQQSMGPYKTGNTGTYGVNVSEMLKPGKSKNEFNLKPKTSDAISKNRATSRQEFIGGLLGQVSQAVINNYFAKKAAEYNSPANQMARMKAAGITPAAAAQGITGAPAAQAMQTQQVSQPSQQDYGEPSNYIYNEKKMEADVYNIIESGSYTAQQKGLLIATFNSLKQKAANEAAYLGKQILLVSEEINKVKAETRKLKNEADTEFEVKQIMKKKKEVWESVGVNPDNPTFLGLLLNNEFGDYAKTICDWAVSKMKKQMEGWGLIFNE